MAKVKAKLTKKQLNDFNRSVIASTPDPKSDVFLEAVIDEMTPESCANLASITLRTEEVNIETLKKAILLLTVAGAKIASIETNRGTAGR